MPEPLEPSDKEKSLRTAVQVGVDQADRGEVIPLTREVVDEVKRRGRRRQAARKSGQRP